MGGGSEANVLTDSLLSVIRQQRHLATRIIIATQEPTIAPALLDLCSMTVVHRFTSPAWLKALEGHLAGFSLDEEANKGLLQRLFSQIVRLNTGQVSRIFSLLSDRVPLQYFANQRIHILNPPIAVETQY